MLNLDYAAVHRFVEGYPAARWDGWDVLIFKPSPAGASHPKGARLDGNWGIQTRISPDASGRWSIRV